MMHIDSPMKDIQSMEEARAFVASLEGKLSERTLNIIRFYYGLLPNSGVSETVRIGGEDVQIDRSIAEFIQECNASGYRTLACCSGLRVEHPVTNEYLGTGYVAIKYQEDFYKMLDADAEKLGIHVRHDAVYFEDAIVISLPASDDEELKKKWQELYKYLLGKWK